MNTKESTCWERLERTLNSEAVREFINTPPPNFPCIILCVNDTRAAGAAEDAERTEQP